MNQIEEITYRYLSSCLGDLSEATEDDVIDAIARINLITRALNEQIIPVDTRGIDPRTGRARYDASINAGPNGSITPSAAQIAAETAASRRRINEPGYQSQLTQADRERILGRVASESGQDPGDLYRRVEQRPEAQGRFGFEQDRTVTDQTATDSTKANNKETIPWNQGLMDRIVQERPSSPEAREAARRHQEETRPERAADKLDRDMHSDRVRLELTNRSRAARGMAPLTMDQLVNTKAPKTMRKYGDLINQYYGREQEPEVTPQSEEDYMASQFPGGVAPTGTNRTFSTQPVNPFSTRGIIDRLTRRAGFSSPGSPRGGTIGTGSIQGSPVI